jgi:opacity protein-like surface antigen
MDAIRAGLSIDFGKSDGDAETNQYDSVNVAEASYNSNNFSITLKSQYIRYFIETDGIAFYGGTGPFVTYSTSTYESETTGSPNDKHYKDTNDNFILGVDFIAGVEWFFIKNMSLSAEYGFNFSYRSRTSEREIDNNLYSDSNEKLYRFSGNDINFGITVYF